MKTASEADKENKKQELLEYNELIQTYELHGKDIHLDESMSATDRSEVRKSIDE